MGEWGGVRGEGVEGWRWQFELAREGGGRGEQTEGCGGIITC